MPLRALGKATSLIALGLLVLTTTAAFLPVPWPFALAEHGKAQLVIGGAGFAVLMFAFR